LPTSGWTFATVVLAAVNTVRISFSVVASGASRNMMVVCSETTDWMRIDIQKEREMEW